MLEAAHVRELMDAVILELQVQVGVGEAAGAPMLTGHDLAAVMLRRTVHSLSR
jgi:hypothetical protein